MPAKVCTRRRRCRTMKRMRGGMLTDIDLKKEINENFQFIQEWVIKGKQSGPVPYSALSSLSDILTIYLHTKYQNACPLFPLELRPEKDFRKFYAAADPLQRPATFEEYKELVDSEDSINWNIHKFLKNLQVCLETGVQVVVVSLRLPDHLNMVVLKARTREVVLFDPHGAQEPTAEVTGFMENLTQHINTFLDLKGARQFTYISPKLLCPRRRKDKGKQYYKGFQQLEALYGMGDDDGGFCQLWSWFFAECVLANPTLSVQEVYRKAFDFLHQNDERDFARVIRGYFISINTTLRRMRLSIKKGFVEHLDRDRDLLLAFLKQDQRGKKDLPQQPFHYIGHLKRKYNTLL